MSDWTRLQRAPTKEIVAAVFDRMDGRSDTDPLTVWADGVLALCERIDARDRRIATLEARLARVLRLVGETGYEFRWTDHNGGGPVFGWRAPLRGRNGRVWSRKRGERGRR